MLSGIRFGLGKVTRTFRDLSLSKLSLTTSDPCVGRGNQPGKSHTQANSVFNVLNTLVQTVLKQIKCKEILEIQTLQDIYIILQPKEFCGRHKDLMKIRLLLLQLAEDLLEYLQCVKKLHPHAKRIPHKLILCILNRHEFSLPRSTSEITFQQDGTMLEGGMPLTKTHADIFGALKRYRVLLEQVVSYTLPMVDNLNYNIPGMSTMETEFSSAVLALCYFRIPNFQRYLIQALQTASQTRTWHHPCNGSEHSILECNQLDYDVEDDNQKDGRGNGAAEKDPTHTVMNPLHYNHEIAWMYNNITSPTDNQKDVDMNVEANVSTPFSISSSSSSSSSFPKVSRTLFEEANPSLFDWKKYERYLKTTVGGEDRLLSIEFNRFTEEIVQSGEFFCAFAKCIIEYVEHVSLGHIPWTVIPGYSTLVSIAHPLLKEALWRSWRDTDENGNATTNDNHNHLNHNGNGNPREKKDGGKKGDLWGDGTGGTGGKKPSRGGAVGEAAHEDGHGPGFYLIMNHVDGAIQLDEEEPFFYYGASVKSMIHRLNAFLVIPEMLNRYMYGLFHTTNLHVPHAVESCLNRLKEWIALTCNQNHLGRTDEALDSTTVPASVLLAPTLPPDFDAAFFVSGIHLLLQSEHYDILKRVLLFLYLQLDLLGEDVRYRLFKVLTVEFYRLFLHWNSDVRHIFHYLLVYRVVRYNRYFLDSTSDRILLPHENMCVLDEVNTGRITENNRYLQDREHWQSFNRHIIHIVYQYIHSTHAHTTMRLDSEKHEYLKETLEGGIQEELRPYIVRSLQEYKHLLETYFSLADSIDIDQVADLPPIGW